MKNYVFVVLAVDAASRNGVLLKLLKKQKKRSGYARIDSSQYS